MPLHGPGIYYLDLPGTRKQPVFRSVFEYEYGLNILAHLSDTQLIAWLFTPDRIRCVVETRQEWPELINEIQSQFADQHEVIWRKHQMVISEQSKAFAVEPKRLVELVLQLHRTPVYEGLVPDAQLFQWSSDQVYRSQECPDWLARERMLNQLSGNRHRQIHHYADAMESCPPPSLDLVRGTDSVYQVIGGSKFIALKRQYSNDQANTNENDSSIEDEYSNAASLVASQLGITPAELMNHQESPKINISQPKLKRSRSFQRYIPLVHHLLLKEFSVAEVAKVSGVKEEDVTQWNRSLKAEHAPRLVKRLEQAWQVAKSSGNTDATGTEEETLATPLSHEGKASEDNADQASVTADDLTSPAS